MNYLGKLNMVWYGCKKVHMYRSYRDKATGVDRGHAELCVLG